MFDCTKINTNYGVRFGCNRPLDIAKIMKVNAQNRLDLGKNKIKDRENAEKKTNCISAS